MSVRKFAPHQTSFDFELDRTNATLRALNDKALAQMKKHVSSTDVIHDRSIDIDDNPVSMDGLQGVIEADGFKVRVIGAQAKAA